MTGAPVLQLKDAAKKLEKLVLEVLDHPNSLTRGSEEKSERIFSFGDEKRLYELLEVTEKAGGKFPKTVFLSVKGRQAENVNCELLFDVDGDFVVTFLGKSMRATEYKPADELFWTQMLQKLKEFETAIRIYIRNVGPEQKSPAAFTHDQVQELAQL